MREVRKVRLVGIAMTEVLVLEVGCGWARGVCESGEGLRGCYGRRASWVCAGFLSSHHDGVGLVTSSMIYAHSYSTMV